MDAYFLLRFLDLLKLELLPLLHRKQPHHSTVLRSGNLNEPSRSRPGARNLSTQECECELRVSRYSDHMFMSFLSTPTSRIKDFFSRYMNFCISSLRKSGVYFFLCFTYRITP